MAEHDFTINFKVNNQETKAARQEEAQGYQAVEQAATASIQRIGKARDDVARKATENVRQLLTEEQALAKAKESLIDQTNRKAVKAAMEQLDATKKAASSSSRDAAESECTVPTLPILASANKRISCRHAAPALCQPPDRDQHRRTPAADQFRLRAKPAAGTTLRRPGRRAE